MKDPTKTIRKKCEKCNKPFSTSDDNETLCRECRAKADFEERRAKDLARKENAKKVAKEKTCIDCGKTFAITNGEMDFFMNHDYGEPVRCPDCRALHRSYVKRGLDNVGMETTCVDCGAKVAFTNRELYWYVSRGYSIPTRCKTCREKRNAHFLKLRERQEKKNASAAAEKEQNKSPAKAVNTNPAASAEAQDQPEATAAAPVSVPDNVGVLEETPDIL